MCPLQLPNPSLSRYYPIRFDEDKAAMLVLWSASHSSIGFNTDIPVASIAR